MKKFLTVYSLFLSVLLFSSENESTSHVEKIVLGSGCFWGAEKGYEALDGVIDAVSGYADGEGVRPTYRDITKFSNKFNPNNHAEVVEVTYNKNLITLEELIIHYLESHDPTQLNRQGNDIGTQYRSGIYTFSEEDLVTANKSKSLYQEKLNKSRFGIITTEIKRASKFYFAEEYHQQYLIKNPNGYCALKGTGIEM